MAIIGKLIANFCALFLAIDIMGKLSPFLSITDGKQPKQIRKILLNSVYFIFFFSLGLMFLCGLISTLLGVSSSDIQISGGVLLFSFLIFVLLRKQDEVSIVKDSTLFPAVAQLIITPVFFIMLLVLMSLNGFIITALSLFVNMIVVLYFLINGSKLIGGLDPIGSRVVSRIVNILLCAYAVMVIRQAILTIL
ncbi:MAG: MarC family protein [Candidatus Omnitrophica bacterium]|nr:MarC family protein [Candidatus Omnitrophota bacterium]